MRALALSRVVMVTPDLEAAVRFYGAALGCALVGRGALSSDAHAVLGTQGRRGAWARLRLGEQEIELVAFDPPGRPYPADSGATDLWFQHIAVVTGDAEAASAAVLAAGGTPLSTDGPEQLPASAGGVTAIKLRDPDGHPLELLQFPPGGGDPRWHRAGAPLVRGYDHSAIAVSDADAVAAFYGETLGLTRAKGSVNHGPAQQRLDAVAADIVDVVPLLPQAPTPHVELLGYRVGPRRPMDGQGPADVAATRLVFKAEGLAEGAGTPCGDDRRAVALADPDGHRLIVVA